MKNVLGIIFADSHYDNMGVLTSVRPLGALPVAGRYRLIDFVLSNMVNSGMINVAVVTQNNYHSLMAHLGSGKQYNLSRKRYGLTLFPPFSNVESGDSDSRIDILYGLLHFLKRSSQDYVLLCDANIVMNSKYDRFFEEHLRSKADISIAYQKIGSQSVEDVSSEAYLYVDEDNCVKDIEMGSNISGSSNKYLGHILISRQTLINIIENSKVRGKKGYLMNLVSRNIGKLNIRGYQSNVYARKINTINEFYQLNMDLLQADIRKTLFKAETSIFTKEKDMVPTRYQDFAKMKNSFIADGCIIDGTVENSILFRGVTVKKGAIVKNAIIFENTLIDNNAELEHVICDKNVIVRENKRLVGADGFPVVVEKNKVI